MKPFRWLSIIIVYTLLTLAFAYIIPSDSLLVVFRFLFGIVFVVFLPGYCLVNILFVGRNRLDPVELVVLSVALSFGIAGLVGLFLGLSPIGITFVPLTISLSVVTIVLAVIAFIRKRKEPVLTQAADQISS
ncbi:MAG TPA: DUF1616 domain-containing protein [Candidatus Sulfotelmatobacter sp.]|nr:DUF1616 domain-containing protein [Candidatus Sulfotelmatobacter sp.]